MTDENVWTKNNNWQTNMHRKEIKGKNEVLGEKSEEKKSCQNRDCGNHEIRHLYVPCTVYVV